MTSFPANIARVPNLLASRLSLGSITRTNLDLLRLNTQLATGRAVNKPSDDAVKAATISVLDQRLERGEQVSRNLDHADSALGTLDQALGEANDLINQASSIASTQLNIGTSAGERTDQAVVINSLIRELFQLANTEGIAGYSFGGSKPGEAPVEQFRNGYRYVGQGSGLLTDIGLASSVPITLGGNNAIGSTSTRVVGTETLIPDLTADTRLADLLGARGLGVTPGELEFSFDGGPRTTINLSNADTVGDVADMIEGALHDYEAANGTTILDTGGVSFSGQNLTVDVAGGSPAPTLEFFDIGTSTTARDLGLASDSPFAFDELNPDGLGVEPELSPLTRVDSVFATPLDSIKINNMGGSRIVDLSTAETFQDIANLIESAGLGLRVEIDHNNRRLVVVNEAAGGADDAMSIEEVTGGIRTATTLGIRTLNQDTRIEDFNDGRGVQIVTGSSDPITGLPDPAGDVDFTITLGDGSTIGVNLRDEDIVTVGTVIARIRSEADAQLPVQGVDPADFTVSLSDGSNGFELSQSSALGAGGAITITRENGSFAGDQLGLMDGTYDASSATLTGEDSAKVRVDNLFTALIDLRNALEGDDDFGISLAAEKLNGFVGQVAQSRALVGGYARRVENATQFEEDRSVWDQTVKSQLQDLDYVEATSRFSLLQTQLEAGLRTATASNTLSLLDFLG